MTNVRVMADDSVPPGIRREIATRAEKVIRGAGAGDYVEITVSRRNTPTDIYSIHVGTPGDGYQQDFEDGDIHSERLDMWLEQQGKHVDASCWCGHPPEAHAIPQCTTCEL